MGTIPNAKKGTFWWFKPEDPRIVIITDPGHKLFDRRTLQPPSEALIESIAKDGMRQAIEIRKIGDEYQVVFGRKRVQAAREAAKRYPDKKILIKAMPATMTDAEALKDATIENSLRVDDSASVKGFNAARLIEAGYDDQELERMFGVSIGTINGWVDFHENATDEVKAALDEGKLTYTDAKKISRKPSEKQSDALAKAIRAEKPRPGPKKGPRRPTLKFKAVITEDNENPMQISIPDFSSFETEDLVFLRDELHDAIQDEIERRIASEDADVSETGDSSADDVGTDTGA